VNQERRQCCFCADAIAFSRHDPLTIHMTFSDGSSQALFAHSDCFGSRLHQSVPWLSRRDHEDAAEWTAQPTDPTDGASRRR
jgi:hypothetical protein